MSLLLLFKPADVAVTFTTFREALVSHLEGMAGLTAIVGEAIYPVVVPQDQDPSAPAVIYRVVSATRTRNHAGPAGQCRRRVQFYIVGNDYLEVESIMESLRIEFDGYAGTLGFSTIEVSEAIVQNERNAYVEPRLSGGGDYFKATLDVIFRHSEEPSAPAVIDLDPDLDLTFAEALLAHLDSIADLTEIVGEGIYPVRISEAQTVPAVTYRIAARPHTRALEGPLGQGLGRVEIKCIDTDYYTASQCAEAIRLAFDGFKGYLGGSIRIDETILVNEKDRYKKPKVGTSEGRFLVIFDYKFRHAEDVA